MGLSLFKKLDVEFKRLSTRGLFESAKTQQNVQAQGNLFSVANKSKYPRKTSFVNSLLNRPEPLTSNMPLFHQKMTWSSTKKGSKNSENHMRKESFEDGVSGSDITEALNNFKIKYEHRIEELNGKLTRANTT
jgi:hypothetical protein